MRPRLRWSRFALLAAPAVALPALTATTASDLRAQSDTGTTAAPVPPWERRSGPNLALGAGGVYQTGRGGSGGRVADGGGFDVFGSVGVASLALGVGYQRLQHRLPGSGTGLATYQGVFLEPRVSVTSYRNFTPYVAGRVAFLRQDVPASATYAADGTSVVTLGAGVGTLVWLAPGVSLDLGGMYSDVRAGSRSGAAVVPGPFLGGTGGGVMLRAGMVLGLDRWGR
jgi:hypothetical protein